MDHTELADALFHAGYNCAQSVFCAYTDVTGLDRETAAKLASSFGGGMGRMREVCGAVSGALMVLGIARGYADPEDPEAKAAHYLLVRDFAARFRERYGSVICRELLGNVPVTPGGTPEERTAEFYKRRPCPDLIRGSASILDEMLAAGKDEEEENK